LGTDKLTAVFDRISVTRSVLCINATVSPPEIIQYAVWVYFRFNLSIRDVEDLLTQRGVIVGYKAIRLSVNKFGSKYPTRLQRSHHRYGGELFIDEIFIKIRGKQYSNNKAEQSHEGARVRERVMRTFKSVTQANRFL
jgi:transposase-like protein